MSCVLQDSEFNPDSVYMEGSSGYSNDLATAPEIIIEPPRVTDVRLIPGSDPVDPEVPPAGRRENFSDDYNEIVDAGSGSKEEFGKIIKLCFFSFCRCWNCVNVYSGFLIEKLIITGGC